MKEKAIVTYLVSGDDNISPSDAILRRTGRRVRHDNQVNPSAAAEMKAGRRFVVVAHGRPDGTVMWFRSDTAESAPWLWIGMTKPPKGARVYLYACHAGNRLPRYLKHCKCFGHGDVVPMPDDDPNDVVLAYMNVVDRLMQGSAYDIDQWRSELGTHVNDALVREVDNPSYIGSLKLLILRKSLGNYDG